MGGGFMFAANSAATPPFSAATRSFPTPATCTGSQPCYCSENDSIFGPVPSRAEVESAILELQRFIGGVSSTNPELEVYHHHSKMLQYPGFIKVSDAFAMMQAEPPLQSLVASISCDKAVWEAILSNKAVDDLRASIAAAGKEEKQVRYPEEGELAEVIWRWIIGFTKSKVIEMVEKFVSVVTQIIMFKHAPKETPASELHHLLDEKVGSSLLLSVVVLLIVVVARGHH